jgi:hypothetical protein
VWSVLGSSVRVQHKQEGESNVSLALKIALAIVALTASVGTVYYNGALSTENWIYQGGGSWKDGGYHGAPGPIVGASLPVLAVGFGVYWLVRRRRNSSQ